MDGLSSYVSRKGILSCSREEVYKFVTDLRNFERFIPERTVHDLVTEADSCSFSAAVAGRVNVRITGKEPFSKVTYGGDALGKNDFSLELGIDRGAQDKTEVQVILEAELNPMLKMVANQPINQFLELLIREMENFTDWSGTR